MKLLNASDGSLLIANITAMLDERGPDLSRAENDALDLIVCLNLAGCVPVIWNDPLELRRLSSELGQIGTSHRVTE
jgi:hypothetical protein